MKILEKIEEKVMPIADKIARQKHLQSIRDGLIITMPMILIGSLFLIIAFLPITGYPEFMKNIFGELWRKKLLYPASVCMDLMGIFITFAVAYRLAEKYKIDAITSGAIALLSFFLVTPFEILHKLGDGTIVKVSGIPTMYLGSKGIFLGIIIAIISTEIFRKVLEKDIVIKMPDSVPSAVSKSFTALVPMLIVILVMWGTRLLVETTKFENLHILVSKILSAPIASMGGTLLASVVAMFFVSLFWSLGIHGISIVASVMAPIWYAFRDENRVAFQQGMEILPNIFTAEFFNIFISMGGSGATISLAILLLKGRSSQIKELSKLGVIPAIFNINEPIIFGLPIIMNPIMIIPFIIVPVVLTVITWMAMNFGIVPKPVGIAIPWTMPVFISGYLVTGGKIAGAIMQLVNIIVGLIIYYPFFKLWDEKLLKEENKEK